jgi:ferredoxin
MSVPKLKFVIDKEICSGHGRCFDLAPQSFESDDIGYGQVLDRPHSPEERQAMDDIAVSCPEGAISVEEV